MIKLNILKNPTRNENNQITWEEEPMYFSTDDIRKIQPGDKSQCTIFTAGNEEFVIRGSAEEILGQWLDAQKMKSK